MLGIEVWIINFCVAQPDISTAACFHDLSGRGSGYFLSSLLCLSLYSYDKFHVYGQSKPNPAPLNA